MSAITPFATVSSTLTACANSRLLAQAAQAAQAALTAIRVSREERIVTHGVICGHVTPGGS